MHYVELRTDLVVSGLVERNCWIKTFFHKAGSFLIECPSKGNHLHPYRQSGRTAKASPNSIQLHW